MRVTLEALARHLQRVEERRHHDHGGAVLVVVEDRDVELLLEPLLDLEAARRGDVLEVDPPEARRDRLYGGDDLVRVVGVEADRERVHVRELLEQHRLALHHRHRGKRADVAEAEHGRAVGHDRHVVPLDRVPEGELRVLVDRLADARHPGGVGHREVVARGERMLVQLGDLAAVVHLEGAIGPVDQLDPLDPVDGVDDLVPVIRAARVDRDVADDLVVVRLDDVDGADRASGAPDRGRHLTQHPGFVVEADAERETERRTRSYRHDPCSWWKKTCK
jgi:hypothetical protein